MISPGPSDVVPGPVATSAAATVRSPPGPAITARASLTMRLGGVSAAGEALARLPPKLERLWIWSEPMSPLASTRPGKAAARPSWAQISAVGVAAPTVWVDPLLLIAHKRAMRLRSTMTVGSGRPARIWGIRSVAPA